MRRRVLTFLLAGLVVLGSVLSCLPLRTSAIVPLGFVQSALASYVSSTGYKLYNDNGTGQDILGSLGELYDDYVTVSNKTITGQLANLAFLVNSPFIYQDNSGQIVVSKVAADIFQDFADWIQTEYSVPVGSDQPTTVLAGSGGTWSDGNGIVADLISCNNLINSYYYSQPIGLYAGTQPLYVRTMDSISFYATQYKIDSTRGALYLYIADGSPSNRRVSLVRLNDDRYYEVSYTTAFFTSWNTLDSAYIIGVGNNQLVIDLPFSSVAPSGNPTMSESAGVTSLAVSLSQAVADVIGQAKEDDAVVIGVGASAGATAQDIADMVAQGVKAQTLDPSVSITAESVIDTPVQPYPDIDGLGLPELGAALVSRFPFCIPWDFVDTVKLFNADPVAPDIAVDLFPAAFKSKVGVTGSTEFRINLGDEKYQKIGTFCRWGSLIGFCFGLAMLTKRMIWTA